MKKTTYVLSSEILETETPINEKNRENCYTEKLAILQYPAGGIYVCFKFLMS